MRKYSANWTGQGRAMEESWDNCNRTTIKNNNKYRSYTHTHKKRKVHRTLILAPFADPQDINSSPNFHPRPPRRSQGSLSGAGTEGQQQRLMLSRGRWASTFVFSGWGKALLGKRAKWTGVGHLEPHQQGQHCGDQREMEQLVPFDL